MFTDRPISRVCLYLYQLLLLADSFSSESQQFRQFSSGLDLALRMATASNDNNNKLDITLPDLTYLPHSSDPWFHKASSFGMIPVFPELPERASLDIPPELFL